MSLTAATVRRAFLHPVLDARAANLEQTSLLHNPTPEPDSVLEIVQELRGFLPIPDSGVSPSAAILVASLSGLALRIAESNLREGRHEVSLAAEADRLVRELRHAELNSGAHLALTAKAIARRLREPLHVLTAPAEHAAHAIVEAARALDAVCARVPAVQLLGPTVERELGARRFALLRELHARRQVVGAARREARDAGTHQEMSDGHPQL